MSKIDLKNTKFKLAINFTLIIFLVPFILVFIYFSFKFLSISNLEKQIFSTFISGFEQQKERQGEVFLNNFFNRTFELQKLRWQRFSLQRDRDRIVFPFVIVDKKGEIIYENLKENMNLENIIDIPNISPWVILDKNWISFYKTFIWNDYYSLFIFSFSYPLKNYLKDLWFFSLFLLLFSFIFYYIWFYFAWKTLQPIEDTFNDMNDFIHNANHELKTPISVINSNLQLIKATKNYEEDLINSSINEIKRIDNLILELSNLSDINSIWDLENLDLKKEIDEILLEYNKIIEGKKLKTDFKINKNIILKSNKNYFYILFSNLLRNAIKYNIESGEINITLEKNKLIISNTWVWISKEDLPNIFDRFFKGEKSRNSEWFGIWLSLVKKICDVYNWKIKVNSDEKITTFEINFKK